MVNEVAHFEAVKVVDVSDEGVTLIEENLGKVVKGLVESGAEQFSVLCVMGATRTGKSFLLDLFGAYCSWRSGHIDEGRDFDSTPLGDIESLTVDEIKSRVPWLETAGDFLSRASANKKSESNTASKASSPKSGPTSPKGDGISPKSSAVSPKGDGVSPKGDGVSPKGDGISPKSGAVSPKDDGASRKSASPSKTDPRQDLTGEADQSSCSGFTWRGGMERCTSGIWMSSTVFVIEKKKSGASTIPCRMAVLVMDTQGAWDSAMSKEQSATLFGLTALLSSVLVYNVSRQVQEDKIENLEFFLECANAAMSKVKLGSSDDKKSDPKSKRDTPRAGKSEETKPSSGEAKSFSAESRPSSPKETRPAASALFQTLHILVRDWSNFESTFTPSDCEGQLKEHLDHHMKSAVLEKTSARIESMFTSLSAYGLSHPGLHVEKRDFSGLVNGLSGGFVVLLDRFFHKLYLELSSEPKKILGREISPGDFAETFKTLLTAFSGSVPKESSLASAVAKSVNLSTKDRALKEYREELERKLFNPSSEEGKSPKGKSTGSNTESGKGGNNTGSGKGDSAHPSPSSDVMNFPVFTSLEDFTRIERSLRDKYIQQFQSESAFGPSDQRAAYCTSLVEGMDVLKQLFEAKISQSALMVLVPLAPLVMLGISLYLGDKASDVLCDWFSDTCVQMSNLFRLIYLTILSTVIGTSFLLLSRLRMSHQSIGAVLELCRQVYESACADFSAIRRAFSTSSSTHLELGQITNLVSSWGKSVSSSAKYAIQAVTASRRVGEDKKT